MLPQNLQTILTLAALQDQGVAAKSIRTPSLPLLEPKSGESSHQATGWPRAARRCHCRLLPHFVETAPGVLSDAPPCVALLRGAVPRRVLAQSREEPCSCEQTPQWFPAVEEISPMNNGRRRELGRL